MVEPKQLGKGVLSQAMQKLNDELRAGLDHGYFELLITCEMISGHKRQLIIKAGKSHRFTIGEDELRE
jgi:hypothetical protein